MAPEHAPLSKKMKLATSCEEYNPMFASLTLLFIYLPSLNVLATLFGPRTAGALGMVWGCAMFIVGVILGLELESEAVTWFPGWAMMFLGMIMLSTGIKSSQDQGKPRNKMLKSQSAVGSRGESILEAAPQFALQCYIILFELTSQRWIKWFSISTSVLSLSLQNIEHYVTARIEEKKAHEEFEGTLRFKMQYSKSPDQLNFKSKEKPLVNLSTDTFDDVFPKSSIQLISKGLSSTKSASFELKSGVNTLLDHSSHNHFYSDPSHLQ